MGLFAICMFTGVYFIAGCGTETGCMSATVTAGQFHSGWPIDAKRVWVGPEYWANRLQDWRIAQGRLECIFSGADRNVHLLTRQLGKQKGKLQMSVRLGCLNKDDLRLDKGWVGFRIGAKGPYGDYRDNAIYGKGINVGITTGGELFIGKFQAGTAKCTNALSLHNVELRLTAVPVGDSYKLALSAHDYKSGKLLRNISRDNISADEPVGNLALVCHKARFWFCDWKVSGSKVEAHDEQVFGPIFFAQHTLSRDILKMTAQMPPMGERDCQYVRLQIRKNAAGGWKTIGKEKIHALAGTATFRIADWDDSRDMPYRLVYEMVGADGKLKEYYRRGTVRRNPVDKETIVVAGFTGNNDLGFPNNDIVKHVKAHNPDMLVFTGDQIYERVGGYGVQRSPMETACLDYLRKWYLWGWSFGELAKDTVCITIPDDHDVYHGNLWGAGGIKAPAKPKDGKYPELYGPGYGHAWSQDQGGYKMPPEWVRMVEHTQTSHLPDPYDPTPVEQGIGVYYCEMNYGGVSFAIIEDRKFKSSPTVMVTEGKVVNGFFQNPDFDAAKHADVPGAKLLGDRQLKFLRDWSANWSNGIWMKVVVSQTIFADVATLPKSATSDVIVPKLRIMPFGAYPKDDRRTVDADTNGWPQTGRNRALRQMRRGFAFHIAGDQHLGSTIQYGIDEWNDAGFALCVPAIANIWPRRWFPSTPGLNRRPDSPRYTGDFKDGFGNLMTVCAVSNPVISGHKPAKLHDRATGYGVVKFNRNQRTITIECWPRYADPTDPKTGGQYFGWPITIKQTDNYARKAAAYLPTIKTSGMVDPVVQVIDEANGEIVYTLRTRGMSFRPKVFRAGTYTVKVGEPGTARMKTLKGVQAVPPDMSETIEVNF